MNGQRQLHDTVLSFYVIEVQWCIYVSVSYTIIGSDNGLSPDWCQPTTWINEKNIERHTADTIVSWPNPKQWVIAHTSDLMMIIRQSIYIFSIITREMGKLKTYSPTYCIMDNGENMLNFTHTPDKIYDGLLSIGPWGTYFNEILFEIQTFSLMKMHRKLLSAKMVAILSWSQCVKMIS